MVKIYQIRPKTLQSLIALRIVMFKTFWYAVFLFLNFYFRTGQGTVKNFGACYHETFVGITVIHPSHLIKKSITFNISVLLNPV